jgi:ribosomal protein L29
VDSVLAGFNGAIMAYGQTAAGKSYTMEGPSLFDKNSQGIISRSVEKLFRAISQANDNIQFQIIASYLEVYCEKIRDLLNPQQDNMKIRESKSEGFLVHDLTEAICKDKDDVLHLIEQGKANRASAPTLMNAESSRSHSIFSISVIQKNLDTGRKKKARLFLVDLAGSEKVSKSGASGTRLEEAKNINMSLTTLGMVINALCEGLSHVPFRDSKLTKVLMETLGGNSKTVLVICCAPEPQHLPETISTLRFGERAKKVRNKAIVNEEISVEELKSMLEAAKQEILLLRAKVAALESGQPVNAEQVKSTSDPAMDLMSLDTEEKNVLPKRGLGTRRLSVKSLEIASTVEDLLSQTDNEWKDDLYEPLMQATETIAKLESQLTMLHDDIEVERGRYEQERDWRLHLESEVSVLKGVVNDLESRLLKQSLESPADARPSLSPSGSVYNSSFHDGDSDDENQGPKIFKITKGKAAMMSAPGSSPMLKQHRDDEQSVNFSKLYDLMEGIMFSLNKSEKQQAASNATFAGTTVVDEDEPPVELPSPSSLGEKYDAMKYDFEKHIEKLRARLAEEHELRLNAEMEMEKALLKLDKLNGGRRSLPPSQQSVSGDFFSFFSSSLGLAAPIDATSDNNQIALALEESQLKVAELVAELEATKEAHAIASETKEGVLRQLMRQNTKLSNDVSYPTIIIFICCS